MKKVAVRVAGGLLLLLVAYAVYRWCRSDEARIRELLAGMAADFNAGSVGDCVDGLAADYREELLKVRKEQVHQYLVALWFREKDPKTGGFPFRVDISGEEVKVRIDPATSDRAEVELLARFADVRREEGRSLWQVRIQAQLAKVEGEWLVKSSRHENVEGRQPF